MFIIYRILFLPFKKIQIVRITPYQIPLPPTGGIPPLKKHWGWEYIHTFKPSDGGNLFLSKYSISKSAIENNTTSKRKASSHCLPSLSAGGGEGGGVKLCNVG